MNLKFELLKTFVLPDFPSGSSINFYDKKLFLIGDDASHILIVDDNYQKIDAIHLFDSPVKRIPKKEKADFETSALLRFDERDYLIVFGSGSRKNRTTIILIDLGERSFESHNYRTFIKRIKDAGIEEVNIECSTVAGNQIILGNRGNMTNPKNHIIVTSSDFWHQQYESTIAILETELIITSGSFIGISEMSYLESKDLLFFTLSTEHTGDSFQDGAIGDSYIGWISSFSNKVGDRQVKLDGMINLTEVSSEFKNHKIEGVCIEAILNDEFIAHLISDNDQGESTLFKLKINID